LATGWKIGVLGFDFRRGLRIFLFTTASRTALGPTQPPIQGVIGAISLGVKRPRSKNEWNYISTLSVSLHGVVLSVKRKHRDNFTFTLPLEYESFHIFYK
jgi:hypothetical protein